jgi:hypothetical protein
MPSVLSRKFRKLFIFFSTLFSLISSSAFADLEQKMLPINSSEKMVTFTFYHFDSSKSASLTDVAENLGKTAAKQNSAAISASAHTNFTYQSGSFVFPETTSFFIKNATLVSPSTSQRSNKFTFILTNESGRHAICYAPPMTESQLGFALQQYMTATKAKYSTAVIIDSGNQCGFYKSNGKYLPYYLKELKKADKAILVN